MIISLILTLVVVTVAVMFSLENTTMIQITFFGYPVQGPEGLFMLISLGVGIVMGVILMVPSIIGRSWALAQHRRKLAELEQNPPRRTAKKKKA